MSRRDDLTIRVLVKHRTDRAVLVERLDGSEHWLPLSQLVDEDAPDVGRRGEVAVLGWLAEERGLDPDPPGGDDGPDIGGLHRACRPAPPRRRVRSAAFGDGWLVEERGDRVVADFHGHGRRTLLRARVELDPG